MDDSTKTIEVLGLSFDDTALTNLVCAMQDAGMSVRCQTADLPHTSEQIADGFADIEFRVETGLYSRLKTEFERRKLRRTNP